ncbi:MAG: hypothetical protein AAF437_03650 [Pseudomonadota bacterium]
MSVVYIHIGRGKTGSTSFQSFCALQSDFLEAYGYSFPLAAGAESLSGHDTFAKAQIDEFPAYMKHPKNVPEAMLEFTTLLQSSESSRIIVSSEQLELANPRKVRAYFERVLPHARFKILYVVRRQDEVAESEYNQLVKLGRFVGRFPEFVASTFEGDYYRVAKAWSMVFGPGSVQCLPYYPGQDSTRLLLDACGFPDTQLPETKQVRKNQSLKMEQLIAIRSLHLLGRDTGDKMIAELRSVQFETGTPALFFDAAEARAFRNLYAKSNQRLISEFMPAHQVEIGGRKYSDETRDATRKLIAELNVL